MRTDAQTWCMQKGILMKKMNKKVISHLKQDQKMFKHEAHEDKELVKELKKKHKKKKK